MSKGDADRTQDRAAYRANYDNIDWGTPPPPPQVRREPPGVGVLVCVLCGVPWSPFHKCVDGVDTTYDWAKP